MKLRNLGKSGLRVSVVGLGCNNFGIVGLETSRQVIHTALDLGITLFDTADTYGPRGLSEEHIGQVLGTRRQEIVLATKFGNPMDNEGRMKGGSRRYLMSAVEASLRRLRTDWIDLYQLHMPDPLTPMDETLRALDDLVRQGKVRYAGCSNVPAWQVADAHWIARDRGLNGFVSCQDEYSLLWRAPERELIPATEAYGMGLLPFFPLAGGVLTGKYRRDAVPADGTRLARARNAGSHYYDKFQTPEKWTVVERLTAFAAERGHSLLELAISWLAAQKSVSSVIAGATKPEQVEANASAASWELTPADQTEIDTIAAL